MMNGEDKGRDEGEGEGEVDPELKMPGWVYLSLHYLFVILI